MNRKLLLVAVLSVIAVAACKPQAPVEPAATPAAPVAAETASAPAPVHPEPVQEVPFDTKGFAGMFTGTLPCADCPGLDTEITLNRDGTYTLHEVHQGKPDRIDSAGTWTAEENGKRLRLDPDSKAEQDRLFAVVSNDRIEQLDAEGKALPTQAPHALTRTGPATK